MAGGALRGRTIGSRAEGVVIEGDGVIVRILRLQQLPHEVLRPLHVAAGRLPRRGCALAPACSMPHVLTVCPGMLTWVGTLSHHSMREGRQSISSRA